MILPNKEEFDGFKSIPGAFSVTECIALINICAEAPQGIYLELGTHKGKSAYAAVYSLKPGAFNLVDPIFKDEELAKKVQRFVANATEKMIFCPTIADESLNVIPQFKDLAYVFVDSAAHDDMVMEEVKLLEDRVVQNGIIAFHDYLNQFTAVERAYKYLLSTGKYEEIKIDWQPIFDYVKEHNLEEGNNSWHQYPELPHPPNFVGAVKRK